MESRGSKRKSYTAAFAVGLAILLSVAGLGMQTAGAATAGLRLAYFDGVIIASGKNFGGQSTVQVKATVTNGSGVGTARADANGRFLLGFMPPEGYEGLVEIAATEGGVTIKSEISVPASEESSSSTTVPTTNPATTVPPTAAPTTSPSTTTRPTTTVPQVRDSGPAGEVSWSGYNWTKETLAAGQTPALESNISGPDTQGDLTLRLTNDGSGVQGAELVSTKAGWGYGTYTPVVSGPLSTMGPANVFGGFFTYDGNVPITHNEIDFHETARWGTKESVGVDHNFYRNNGGKAESSVAGRTPIPADLVQTHVVTWAPGKITWDSYIGVGTSGKLIKHSEATNGVPVPAKERMVVNLWAFSGNGAVASEATPIEVKLKSFSFVPA